MANEQADNNDSRFRIHVSDIDYPGLTGTKSVRLETGDGVDLASFVVSGMIYVNGDTPLRSVRAALNRMIDTAEEVRFNMRRERIEKAALNALMKSAVRGCTGISAESKAAAFKVIDEKFSA
jgi:hypothetical protein